MKAPVLDLKRMGGNTRRISSFVILAFVVMLSHPWDALAGSVEDILAASEPAK